MDPLTLLSRRRQAIAGRLDDLERERGALRGELAELESAERVFRRLAADDDPQPLREAPGEPAVARPAAVPDWKPPSGLPVAPAGRVMYKDAVLDILRDAFPGTLARAEVVAKAGARGVGLHKKTVSTSLRRWARGGKARQVGAKWQYVPNGEAVGAGDAGPAEAPEGNEPPAADGRGGSDAGEGLHPSPWSNPQPNGSERRWRRVARGPENSGSG